MSEAIGIGLLGASIIGTALFTTPRYLAAIVPDCAEVEEPEDLLTITTHPVQRGANISDHAYKEPATIKLRWAWSNSAPANTGGYGLGTLTGFTGAPDYVIQIYEQLQALQVSGATFALSTGKRLYPAMLISRLAPITNYESEFSLPCDIECREVIIVDTQMASIPAADQAVPQQSNAVANQGAQQAQPTTTPPPSLLSTLNSSLGSPF
jgi:hypothetical protein